MNEQPELALRTPAPRQPLQDSADLCAILREYGQLTATQIEGLRPEWADPDHRYVRRLAATCPEIVSGPGVRGYALAEQTTIEQLEHIIAKRHAQIRAEGAELIRLKRLLGVRKAARALTTTATLS